MDGVAQKVCKRCGETKPLTDFYANAGNRDGRRPECKACNLAAQKARRRANPEPNRARARAWQLANPALYRDYQKSYAASGRRQVVDRAYNLKRKYGVTVEWYDEMLEMQGGGCAICGRRPPDGGSLHVDHCHDTGEVRALLCFSCNSGLGDFHHNPDLLQIAIDYLTAEPE